MKSIRARLPNLLDRLHPSETAVLFGTAIAVGVVTGFSAVLLIELIELFGKFFFEGGERVFGFLGRGLFLFVPAVGGLLIGLIITFFAKEVKGGGVPEVMQALALRGGQIRHRIVAAKMLASALCIGSGNSAGREGPIVQIGAGIGSTLGQVLHLSDVRIKNLVACGAAAGIAAVFNAPITGAIFALEVILGELHLGDLGNVIISAVTASTIARIFLGDSPAFSIPRYAQKVPWEILLFVVLGIIAAFVAISFTRLLYWVEDSFDSWHFPEALKPAVGGLLLGILATVYMTTFIQGSSIKENMPHIFGSGFWVIEGALLNRLSFGLLFALIFLKIIATSFTLGSGNSGGDFAPLLFIGAVLGGTYGRVIDFLAPGLTAGAGAFATVGMAAVFAGAVHAPFTAILLVFEMTDDYRLIVPLMASVITSLLISQKIQGDSIYTLKLARRGIRLFRGRDIDILETVRVEEIMTREPAVVSDDMEIGKLSNEFLRTGRHGFAVIDSGGKLFGVVSLEDYRRVTSEDPDSVDRLRVRDIASRKVITAFPDESVGVALRRMAPRDLSRLPVVDRGNPGRILGVVRRNDIVRAYELGAMRREDMRRQN